MKNDLKLRCIEGTKNRGRHLSCVFSIPVLGYFFFIFSAVRADSFPYYKIWGPLLKTFFFNLIGCSCQINMVERWIRGTLYICFLISLWWGVWSVWLKALLTNHVLPQGLCECLGNGKMLLLQNECQNKVEENGNWFRKLWSFKEPFASVKASQMRHLVDCSNRKWLKHICKLFDSSS